MVTGNTAGIEIMIVHASVSVIGIVTATVIAIAMTAVEEEIMSALETAIETMIAAAGTGMMISQMRKGAAKAIATVNASAKENASVVVLLTGFGPSVSGPL
eukprot:jgi/Chlat1/6262/Chrsp44S09050